MPWKQQSWPDDQDTPCGWCEKPTSTGDWCCAECFSTWQRTHYHTVTPAVAYAPMGYMSPS